MNTLSKLLFKVYLYLKNRFDPTKPATGKRLCVSAVIEKLTFNLIKM